jgi:iron only hydrogenase large subunit-like protein
MLRPLLVARREKKSKDQKNYLSDTTKTTLHLIRNYHYAIHQNITRSKRSFQLVLLSFQVEWVVGAVDLVQIIAGITRIMKEERRFRAFSAKVHKRHRKKNYTTCCPGAQYGSLLMLNFQDYKDRK